MKFKYLTASGPTDSRGKMVKRPMLEIELIGNGGKKINTLGLVDSGADTTMVNLQYADALGINVDKTKTKDVIGIGNGRVQVYPSMLCFKIKYTDYEMTIPVWFIDSQNVQILLGQEVFFDVHKIKFEKDHDTFEINRSLK